MAGKHIRGGIYYAIHRYAKANNKYLKYYNRNKESLYLTYWNVNNLYGWAMLQKLHRSDFMSVKNKTTLKIVIWDMFLNSMFNILKN